MKVEYEKLRIYERYQTQCRPTSISLTRPIPFTISGLSALNQG